MDNLKAQCVIIDIIHFLANENSGQRIALFLKRKCDATKLTAEERRLAMVLLDLKEYL
jgi:hypothetical protein